MQIYFELIITTFIPVQLGPQKRTNSCHCFLSRTIVNDLGQLLTILFYFFTLLARAILLI